MLIYYDKFFELSSVSMRKYNKKSYVICNMTFKLRWLLEVMSGYIMCCFVHWLFSNMYVHFCTPYTGIGFIKTIFLVQSPECRCISWLNNISRLSMHEIFGIFATWCTKKLSYNTFCRIKYYRHNNAEESSLYNMKDTT